MYEFKGHCKKCLFTSDDRSFYRTRNQCKKCYILYCREYCLGRYKKVECRKKNFKAFKTLFKENMPIGLIE